MTTRGRLPDSGENFLVTAINYLIDALDEGLGMTLSEFVRAIDAGELDLNNPSVVPFVPLIPFLREWEKRMFVGGREEGGDHE